MLVLLRRISARDYVSAPVRLGLMVGGIASGIALIAALGIINRSVLANFRTMMERAAGKAALQVTLGTGEVGFAESATPLWLRPCHLCEARLASPITPVRRSSSSARTSLRRRT